jgi:hypothetical protein
MFTVFQNGVAISPVGGVTQAEADAYVARAAAEAAAADAAWRAWADQNGGAVEARKLAIRLQHEAERKAATFDDWFAGEAHEKARWTQAAADWARHAAAMTKILTDDAAADALAWFERESKAALARVLGTPERAAVVEQLAEQREALRRTQERGQ